MDRTGAAARLARRLRRAGAPQSNRAGFDESLAICKLERFVGDTAITQGWSLEAPTEERSGHVAVVGGGPAGLSAAFQLRRRGWRVTLFEARAELGGLMRHGIPPYRLARSVLDAEIARIVALGVVVRCSESVSTPEDFERLRATHDAVFVAVGAARVKRLPACCRVATWPRLVKPRSPLWLLRPKARPLLNCVTH